MANKLQRMTVLAGGILLLSAASAFAQSAPLMTAPAGAPLMAPTPGKAAPPAPEPLIADTHVDSTGLGFEKGIGPAVGRKVTYRDKQYEVVDVVVVGGGPSFSGNSRFSIAPEGHELVIGLKAIGDQQVAALIK